MRAIAGAAVLCTAAFDIGHGVIAPELLGGHGDQRLKANENCNTLLAPAQIAHQPKTAFPMMARRLAGKVCALMPYLLRTSCLLSVFSWSDVPNHGDTGSLPLPVGDLLCSALRKMVVTTSRV